jgi:hypothetical protein
MRLDGITLKLTITKHWEVFISSGSSGYGLHVLGVHYAVRNHNNAYITDN